jgi:hypothetical protein
MCRTQDAAVRHNAILGELPQGDGQLARQGYDHLLAQGATVLGAGFELLGQRALLLVVEEAPRQLDHAPPHPSVAGSGKPFLGRPGFFGL